MNGLDRNLVTKLTRKPVILYKTIQETVISQ